MQTLDGSKPEIDYPTRWGYTLFGRDIQQLRAVVDLLLRDAVYEASQGNSSRTGKYVSLRLEVLVHSDDDRTSIFHRLASHEAVVRII